MEGLPETARDSFYTVDARSPEVEPGDEVTHRQSERLVIKHSVQDAIAANAARQATGEADTAAEVAPGEGSVGSKAKKATAKGPKRTPAKGTPAKGTSAKGTPAKGTPAKGTPAKGTPAKGTPAKGTPAKGTTSEVLVAVPGDLNSTSTTHRGRGSSFDAAAVADSADSKSKRSRHVRFQQSGHEVTGGAQYIDLLVSNDSSMSPPLPPLPADRTKRHFQRQDQQPDPNIAQLIELSKVQHQELMVALSVPARGACLIPHSTLTS